MSSGSGSVETSEKLASIRIRIANIRSLLEDPAALTDVSINGVAESINRESLIRELRDLELEEGLLTGAKHRLYRICFK